jgi:hypothetical protein
LGEISAEKKIRKIDSWRSAKGNGSIGSAGGDVGNVVTAANVGGVADDVIADDVS